MLQQVAEINTHSQRSGSCVARRATGAWLLLRVDRSQAVDFASPRCWPRHDGRMLAVIFDTTLFETALRSVNGPGQRPGMAVR